MPAGNGAHDLIASEQEHIAFFQPCVRLAGGDEEIVFLANARNLCKNAVVIVLEGDKIQRVVRERLAHLVPEIHKRLCRIEHRGSHAKHLRFFGHGAARVFNRLSGIVRQKLCVLADDFARRGQTDAVRAAREERKCKAALERIDLFHHRRGRDEEPLGCLAETAAVRDR